VRRSLGLVVLGAFELGFVAAAALLSVLFTDYSAFIAGMTTYYFFPLGHFRQFYREDTRTRWDFLFDDNDITYKSNKMEVLLAWRALESVEDQGLVGLLLYYGRGIGIPQRVFTDDAARAGFVAAATARIKAAAELAQA
jgi:hypothetical protein